jgi:Peptidase A4 family
MESRGMRFFCSAIIMGPAMAIGAASADDAQDLNRDSKGLVTPHRHGPASIRRLHFDGTAEADNWAGYAIAAATPPAKPTDPTGVTVTSVTGSWVIPEATCSGKSSQYSSFWVGIDGWYSNTVEQIGTDSDCSSGTPSYYAWYEFYPEPSYYAGNLTNLAPGDIISASVTYNASSKNFTATISVNGGKPFSTTFAAGHGKNVPQLSSAEWIAEAPCCTKSGGYLPLANFGTASYGYDYTSITGTNYATVNGVTEPINYFLTDSPATWWATTMVNESYAIPPSAPDGLCPSAGCPTVPATDVMAVTSGLSSDPSSSFTVTWKSAGP